MNALRKTQGIVLILLLLCSVGIAPVMAGDKQMNVVEDGVHLLKFDDSPTKLDPKFYEMDPTEDVVVDGDQNYWVRIGNVKAAGLSSVWWSKLVAFVVLFLIFLGFFWVWCLVFPRLFPTMFAQMKKPIVIGDLGPKGDRWNELKRQLPFVFPLLCSIAVLYCVYSSGGLTSAITHVSCGDYLDLQASDGTILITVDKLHPETNTLYMKSGLNLTTLTHLPNTGNALQRPGVTLP